MSDVHCAVCREPWDSYGVRYGDMLPWEAALFRKGAGCPSCKGKPPEGRSTEEAAESFARDVLIDCAFEGNGESEALDALDGKAPQWRRPKDVELWCCKACGARVMHDIDVETPKVVWPGRCDSFSAYVDGLSWEGGNSARLSSDDEFATLRDTIDAGLKCPDEWIFLKGEKGEAHYCPECATPCCHCGTLTIDHDVDMYDGGGVFIQEGMGGKTYCCDCYEKIPTCSECSEPLGDPDEEVDTCEHGCCEYCRYEHCSCERPADDDEYENSEDASEEVPS